MGPDRNLRIGARSQRLAVDREMLDGVGVSDPIGAQCQSLQGDRLLSGLAGRRLRQRSGSRSGAADARVSLRVLVVDDSQFFRRRLIEILRHDQSIEVVGTAANGLEAVAQNRRLKPDLITMDVQMPVMDGIGATRKIMAERPTAILMVSALTLEGASITFDALEAGAVDYIPKSRISQATGAPALAVEFCQTLRALAAQQFRTPARKQPLTPTPAPAAPPKASDTSAPDWQRYRLLLIGASTGGPMAVVSLVRSMPADFPLPVVIVQHMPEFFTEAFARRLNDLGNLPAAQAVDGETLEAGRIRVAPGGCQLRFERLAGGVSLRVGPPAPGDLYHPSLDHAFSSAADSLGAKVLAMVLTGMGRDGTAGCAALRRQGAEVWAEAQSTCVVYGMPRAVAEAGHANRILPLDEIGRLLGNPGG